LQAAFDSIGLAREAGGVEAEAAMEAVDSEFDAEMLRVAKNGRF
jgi:hypothetical protein